MQFKNKIMAVAIMLPVFLQSLGCTPSSQKSASGQVSPEPKGESAADQQFQELVQPIRQAGARIQREKALTDEDIELLTEIQFRDIKPALPGLRGITVRDEALRQFLGIPPENLKPGQKEKISDMVTRILAADDENSDPDGGIKMYALIIIKDLLQDKRFLPKIESLTKDKRNNISSVAVKTLEELRKLP